MDANEALEGEFPLHTLDAKDENNSYIMTVKLPERLLQEISQNASQITFEEAGSVRVLHNYISFSNSFCV